MTDRSNDIDPAERIRQLQARRAASGRTQRPAAAARVAAADAGSPTQGAAPRSPRGKPRRRHPAAATRWLLGGLSIVSFVGIAGTVAAASSTPAARVSAPATSAATGSAAAAATPVTSKATSATTATGSTARVAHTTSGGS
jgi:hypothetical protein